MTLDRAIEGGRAYGLLAILCLALYLPGLAALPVTDRDEARFAQATRQMLESHDFLRIRFQDEARNKKPAGIYWLQAASVSVASTADSTAIWPYRVPSVLGALAAVLLTFHFSRTWLGRGAAFIGAALLAASLGLTVEAHLAKTDAVLLATVVAAQGALGELYRRGRAGEPMGAGLPLLFWLAQGAGILIKGPITPLVSLLSIAALALADRDRRWIKGLRFAWGVPLLALLVGPWLIAITRATGGAFVTESVGNDLLGKLIHGQESHGAPPGTYLIAMLVTFWPGSVALAAAARLAWRERAETAIRFLIAWIVPFWILMELVPTKLPHYVLPAYPALALLSAKALHDGAAAARRHWADVAAWAIWGVVALGLAGALLAASIYFTGHFSVAAGAGIAINIALAAGMLWSLWHHHPRISLGVGAALAISVTGFAVSLPALDPLWLSRDVATLVAQQTGAGRPIVAAGYAEPSLVFLLGTATKLTTAGEAAAILAKLPDALAVVSNREDAAFAVALAKHGTAVTALGRVSGFNYSNGRAITLTLYEVAK